MDDFEVYFRSADANGNDLISASEAVAFFQRFGLPNNVIAQIWNYADRNKDNTLTHEEFNDALKLISAVQFGHILTPELVQDVLHGPESDKIPAPEVRLMPTASPPTSPAFAGLTVQIPDSTDPPGGSSPVIYPQTPAAHSRSPSSRAGSSPSLSTNPFDPYAVNQYGINTPRTSNQELPKWPKFSQANILKYSKIFNDMVKDKDGRVTGAQARKLFQSWQLPSGVLKHIWDLSDLDMNGELTKKEFFIALYLMERHREGWLLPTSLPRTVLYDEILLQATSLRAFEGSDSGAMTEEWLAPGDTTMSTVSSTWSLRSDTDLYAKLTEANQEIIKLKRESYEESLKLKEAETNAMQAQQKVKTLMVQYIKEVEQRKQLERENITLRQKDAYHRQLQEKYERTIAWGQHIGNSLHHADEVTNDLKAMRFFLDSMQDECNKLQLERDFAIRDADEQRKKREQINCEFTDAELREATQDFDASVIIGEGGFGRVYRGTLRNTQVAIKKLDIENVRGQEQFDQEVEILSKVRHPNLVTLIGASSETCALVYEFLPNGTLEDHLNDAAPLSWQDRTRIIGEICNAILFLHKYKPHPIVHGDLKPANVLLDSSFVSKIGDFGLSRLLLDCNSNNTAIYLTSRPIGTEDYAAPEYVYHGELTVQSDIYSFGVTILRVLTGKSPRGIVNLVDEALRNDTLHQIIDGSAGQWPFVQAKLLAQLGLQCTDADRKNRPDLEEVWRKIEPLMKAATQQSSTLTHGDSNIPPYFFCPITQEVMMDPQFAADGFTYEAAPIKEWLSHHTTSPMTNLQLPHCNVTPNLALRSAIQQYMQERKA